MRDNNTSIFVVAAVAAAAVCFGLVPHVHVMPEAEAVLTCQDGMRASLSSSTHMLQHSCRSCAKLKTHRESSGKATRQQADHVAACMIVRVFD